MTLTKMLIPGKMNGDASIAAGSVDTVENSLTFF